MKPSLLFLLLAVLPLPLQAQTEVAPFRPGTTVDGVCYFLPKTVFRVAFISDKTVTTPGDFAAYADRFLRQPSAPRTETVEWRLKTFSLQPFGVPDSTKAYSIRLKAKTSAPLVTLSDDGLLLGVNTEAVDAPLPALPPQVPAPPLTDARRYMTHDILSATSTAKMAQLTAEEIYDLKDARKTLIRGEADNTPKDGAQLKLMLDNLDVQIAALEGLFNGQVRTSTEVTSFTYEPPATLGPEGVRTLLCRYSRRFGVVDKDDLSGQPVWIELKPVGNLPERIDNPETARKRSRMPQGLYVNVPARVKVTVSTPDQVLMNLDVPVCQAGTTELLSDALFNKHLTTKVFLHPHTGSVREIREN